MRTIRKITLLFIFITFLFAPFVAPLSNFKNTPNAEAAIPDWRRGASIIPTWTDEFSTSGMKESLSKLRATGANYVALTIPHYQSNAFSTDIAPGYNTPSDASLIQAIKWAHELGLKVMLKPHLEMWSGGWRANINPGDRAGWFKAYGDMLNHYGTLANQNGVEDFCIGVELIKMSIPDSNSTNTDNWNTLISNLRKIYSGRLTYSGNWSGGELEKIQFWSNLDYIGVSAYYNLDQAGNNSVSALKGAWDSINRNTITPIHSKWNKPVVFTEVGYRSVSNSWRTPWDWWSGGSYDGIGQANLYEALLSYWNSYSWMEGVIFWEWSPNPNAGGNGEIGYTPQRKEAETILKNYWTGISNPTPYPTPSPAPGQNSTWQSSATANPNPTNSGSTITYSATIKNTSAFGTDAIIDIELYNSANGQVLQKIFGPENFSAGASKNYTVSWQAGTAGTYRLKIGIFSTDWSKLFSWNDGAIDTSVGNAPSGTPTSGSGSGIIDVWWPTDNARVGTETPFKALLRDRAIDSYSMYWQVDGDRLNEMYDNGTDYPHKEVLVGFSGWIWKGNGPYLINFIAKDKNSGTTLSQKSINLFVNN